MKFNNKQQEWKFYWRKRELYKAPNARYWQKNIRREAALERKLEAAQREIAYLKADLQLAREQVAESEERREFAARLEFG